MNKYRVIAYEDSEGYSEVDAFIESVKERDQAKIYSFTDLLGINGPQLPRPYADILRDGIHDQTDTYIYRLSSVRLNKMKRISYDKLS